MYGMRKANVCGDYLLTEPQAVFDFKSRLHATIGKGGITGEQLYNRDETGLNYEM